MPKRSGSNRLKSSRRPGPRSSRNAPSTPAAPTDSSSKGASAKGAEAPVKEATSAPRDKPSKSFERAGSKGGSRRSEPASEVEAAAVAPEKQTLLARFNELPDTTRYAIIGAIVAFVVGIGYFISTSGASSTSSTAPASPGADLAQPSPVVLPPGMLSSASSGALPASPPKPLSKVATPPAPSGKITPPATAPAKPVTPPPASKPPASDNTF